MNFEPYQHIEKWGREEVEGIENGLCYIFPKIDGTNASVWYNDALPGDSLIRCGSRKREISLVQDNHDSKQGTAIIRLLTIRPDLRLYGEWLVPHTLKTYNESAWRKFYVFDVMNENGAYIPYLIYKSWLDNNGIDYIPAIATVKNPTQIKIVELLDTNVYLLVDGCGIGEGIVVKNYDFVNKYDKTIWAKVVTNDFRTEHSREMGPTNVLSKDVIEEKIVDAILTEPTLRKVLSDMTHGEPQLLKGGEIPAYLGHVWHDFVNEELWHILKKYKNPTLDFKKLQRYVVAKIKKLTPEVF